MFSANKQKAKKLTPRNIAPRTEAGISLIEMLTTMFIMGFVAAATCEIFAALNLVSFKANSQFNSILSGRRLVSILAPQIRTARYIGNKYRTVIDIGFPSQDPNSTDPYRPGNSPPPTFKGWPLSTDRSTWPNPPYQLDNQTLIIQVPIRGSGSNGGMADVPQVDPATNTELLDTYVYKVLADKTNSGKGMFTIERAYFPGQRTNFCNEADAIASNQPQTILTGLVGPADLTLPVDPVAGTPPPKVFTYLVPDTVNPISNKFSGVGISCEIIDSSATQMKNACKSTAIRTEFYSRAKPLGPN